MAKTVGQIDRELRDLEQQTAALAAEFHNSYSSYLKLLGQVVRQQLILASYHICTQVYPERFVRLDLNRRQKLQQALQQAAKQVLQHFLAFLPTPSSNDLLTGLFKANLPDALDNESLKEAELEAFLPKLLQNASEGVFGSDIISASEDVPPAREKKDQTITPKDLMLWLERVEKAISDSLDRLSGEANSLLRQVEILPDRQLPEPLMEAAKSANSGEAISAGPPNILTLLIETEDPAVKAASLHDRKPPSKTERSAEKAAERADSSLQLKLSAPIQIMEIYLQLSEIEFSDSTATSWRNKIRNLKAQLNTLGRQYQKQQRERVIAEAEAAWRSSWHEEES